MSESDFTPLLAGIGFSGYRSFATWQQFALPTKITILAGVNNCGKSNVLRFLQIVLPSMATPSYGAAQPPKAPEIPDLDLPQGFSQPAPLIVGTAIALGSIGEAQDPRKSTGTPGGVSSDSLGSYQEGVMRILADEGDLYWSQFTLQDKTFEPPTERVERAASEWPMWSERNSHRVNELLGGGLVDPLDVMRRLLISIGGYSALPKVVTVHGSRRIEDAIDGDSNWLSGRGIIKELATLQNPQHTDWKLSKPKWDAINRFVRTVLGDPNATLNVPHDLSTLQVETPQRVLPLESLGSGIEQVIVLAAAATATQGALVCVEEPETNLHPLLQKQLIRYLNDETDNQYLIATHSSHLLDDSRSTAYHLRLTTSGTESAIARNPHELVSIFHDLGYRPSDLLQANCVVWVEGPSDRIYIRKWLELVSPNIVEGIDYSIMFYGGKLLSHLSVSEDALEDFISLRWLNRSSAVIIDSDKKNSRASINATKNRIKSEFEEENPAPGLCWVTKCYTVENYINSEVFTDAVNEVHPKVPYHAVGQWQNPLPSSPDGPKFDKIGIAHAATRLMTAESLDRYDLKASLTKLSNFIISSNGKSTAADPN